MAYCINCRHRKHNIIEEPCKSCSVVIGSTGVNKFEPRHECSTCKHYKKKITEEPCLSCDIHMRNDKWEGKDEQ